ncbi:hypothetical protein [Aeromonas dhakensis]
MELQLDFKKDWILSLRQTLESNLGYKRIEEISDEDIPILFWNAKSRLLDSKPRKVVLSDTFICPEEHLHGWLRLQKVIESGQDIKPNLSRLVTQITVLDQMLNDWGVHHFHLGVKIKSKFVKRTGPLLFALVTKDIFYAIGVYNHDDWVNADVVETVHRNWPEAISRYRVNGIQPDDGFTEAERATIRDKHANAFFNTSDGTVYAPIGGGVVASGVNLKAVMDTDVKLDFLEKLQEHLISNTASFSQVLSDKGYDGVSPLIAKLKIIDENEYYAFFEDYSVAVLLYSEND